MLGACIVFVEFSRGICAAARVVDPNQCTKAPHAGCDKAAQLPWRPLDRQTGGRLVAIVMVVL